MGSGASKAEADEVKLSLFVIELIKNAYTKDIQLEAFQGFKTNKQSMFWISILLFLILLITIISVYS